MASAETIASPSVSCAVAPRAEPAHAEAQGERPQQVELLLDRERPQVLQQRRALERLEVGLLREDLVPVVDVEERGDRVAARPHGVAGQEDRRHERGDGDDQERGRQQAARAPEPELRTGRCVPVAARSVSSSDVIRKPLSTKKMSTPRNPPGAIQTRRRGRAAPRRPRSRGHRRGRRRTAVRGAPDGGVCRRPWRSERSTPWSGPARTKRLQGSAGRGRLTRARLHTDPANDGRSGAMVAPDRCGRSGTTPACSRSRSASPACSLPRARRRRARRHRWRCTPTPVSAAGSARRCAPRPAPS